MIKFFLVVLLAILFSCAEISAQQGTFNDPRDGTVYSSIKIGDQVWMSENLRYFNDGAVPLKNNKENIAKHGYLYDWETAKEACPKEWHIPTDEEWKELLNYLGGKNKAGGKLKSNLPKFGWKTPNRFATNSSSFNASPSGVSQGGEFSLIGEVAYYWSSEAECTSAYALYLTYKAGFADLKVLPKTDMAAIRCIKD